MDISKYKIEPHADLNLSKVKTNDKGQSESKEVAEKRLAENVQRMAEIQGKLYAQDKYAFQWIRPGKTGQSNMSCRD